MEYLKDLIIEFILVYVIIYLIYLVLFYLKKRTLNPLKLSLEVSYLVNVHHIDISRINYKRYILMCSFLNSFIITFIYIVITKLIKGFIWQMIIGFVLLLLLLLISYEIIAIFYKKKG